MQVLEGFSFGRIVIFLLKFDFLVEMLQFKSSIPQTFSFFQS